MRRPSSPKMSGTERSTNSWPPSFGNTLSRGRGSDLAMHQSRRSTRTPTKTLRRNGTMRQIERPTQMRALQSRTVAFRSTRMMMLVTPTTAMVVAVGMVEVVAVVTVVAVLLFTEAPMFFTLATMSLTMVATLIKMAMTLLTTATMPLTMAMMKFAMAILPMLLLHTSSMGPEVVELLMGDVAVAAAVVAAMAVPLSTESEQPHSLPRTLSAWRMFWGPGSRCPRAIGSTTTPQQSPGLQSTMASTSRAAPLEWPHTGDMKVLS
mmetsp:Transcript_722/g.2169  ORF Transcript_722/g.2169 Transcript_722/m.2169 type:complete len:264 (+) Transcript_722:360-1151(+)